MTYSDYGRGGPGGSGDYQDPRSGPMPSQRNAADSSGAYGVSNTSGYPSYGPGAPGGHDPRGPGVGWGPDTRGNSGSYNSSPYSGDSHGDSGSYGHSGSYGNYGQSFAVGDDFGQQGQASFGYNTGPGGGHHASPGDLVGDRYLLVDLVGKGGNGSVWRANDTVLRREVALKEVFLPPDLPPDERSQLIDRSRREAQIAAGLSHPSVIRVFDVVEHTGLPWIVMELLQARSLADILTADGPLPPRVAAKIGMSLVGALQAAHEAGIIHRDVKPGNVLISTDGRCVLSDFGAAQMNQVSGGTTPGKVLGSAHYIAPERAIGHPAEPASDVFSLGVTLYAAVEGRPPFDRGDAVSTMRAVVQEPPESPRNAGPLTPLLGGMLAKEPHERHSLARVRQELAAMLAGPLAGNTGGLPGGPAPMPSEPPRRQATGGFEEVSPPGQSPARRRTPPPDGPDGDEKSKSNKGRNLAVVAVFVLVVLGLAYLLYLWQFTGDDGDPGGTQPTVEGSPDDATGDGGEDGGEAEEPEPSFETATHEGSTFSANYPSNWGEGTAGDDYADYVDPEDANQWIRFYSGSARGLPDTEAHLSDFYTNDLADMSDLQQHRLEPIEFGGMSGTVLEYSGTNTDGSQVHAVWAIVDAGDGTSYGIFVRGPMDTWDLSQEVFDEALRSFQTG